MCYFHLLTYLEFSFLLKPWSSYILRNVANVKFPTIILFLMTVRLFWDIKCNSISSICFYQALCIFLYKRASVLKPKSVANKMWPLILLYIFGLFKSPNLFLQLQMWTKVPYFKCEQKCHILHSLTTTGDQSFNNIFF